MLTSLVPIVGVLGLGAVSYLVIGEIPWWAKAGLAMSIPVAHIAFHLWNVGDQPIVRDDEVDIVDQAW